MRDQITEQTPSPALEFGKGPSFIDLLSVIRKRLWVIALVTILVAGAVVGFSITQTPVYNASVKILVGQERPADTPFDSNPGALEGEFMGLQQVTQTMVEITQTRPIAQAVIWRLNLNMSAEELLDNLHVEQVHATPLVQVDYKDTDPERAQLIANTVGEIASQQIAKESPSANTITAKVWEQAELPGNPVSPKPIRDGLVALVLGVLLGTALAFLLEHVDGRLRSPAEVEQAFGVPAFGVIPRFTPPQQGAAPQHTTAGGE